MMETPKPEEMQRDLFAGAMAGQIIEEGNYGEEFQCFGLVYWQQGKVQSLISTDETVIFDKLEHCFSKGIVTSPVFSL